MNNPFINMNTESDRNVGCLWLKAMNNCFREGWDLNDAPSVETGAHFSVLYLTFQSLPAFLFVQ